MKIMKKNKVIYNWSVNFICDRYTPPELIKQVIVGKLANGKSIQTSAIVGKEGGLIVTKSGSRYVVSDTHPEYEKQFPNAKKRLLDSLPSV